MLSIDSIRLGWQSDTVHPTRTLAHYRHVLPIIEEKKEPLRDREAHPPLVTHSSFREFIVGVYVDAFVMGHFAVGFGTTARMFLLDERNRTSASASRR